MHNAASPQPIRFGLRRFVGALPSGTWPAVLGDESPKWKAVTSRRSPKSSLHARIPANSSTDLTDTVSQIRVISAIRGQARSAFSAA